MQATIDEKTNAVDIATEGEIKDSLEELEEGGIGMMIAHGLSTNVDADQISVSGRRLRRSSQSC